uniref:Uncharacterized protein n=1 Tax=Fagus sylvatica TaxID=28930 RepID=A0A2N9G0Q1_FAGSY
MAEVLKLIVNLRSQPPTPDGGFPLYFLFFSPQALSLSLSLSLSPLLNLAMADSSFLLSTISLAQMEPTGSKGGTWKAMGGRSVRWRLRVEAMRKRRERG